MIYLSRFMHTSFRPLLALLRIIFLFPEPLFRLRDYFPSLGIFAQTNTCHCNLQPFRRRYALGNGFGRTLWSGIRPSRFSMLSNNLLFINCLKLFKLFSLLFLFIYIQKVNINKTVGALTPINVLSTFFARKELSYPKDTCLYHK